MRLTVYHNNIDYTLKMNDFSSQEKILNLEEGEIFIGYYKPVKNFYVELVDTDSEENLIVEFFDGQNFIPVNELEDLSYGLGRSGLIRFSETLSVSKNLFGKTLHWLKVTTSNPTEVFIKGINLVLSNDRDLSFVPNLQSYLPNGLDSWIAFHQEATSHVVQYLRNSGKTIRQTVTSNNVLNLKHVDQFDLLEIEEFKNASKYYALHLIFDYISKDDNDGYSQKSQRYFQKYLESLNDKLFTIDSNDDGKVNEGEDVAIQFTRLRRE